MGNIPNQRRYGQKGGGNQASNKFNSIQRGGRPSAGRAKSSGGGSKNNGCAVTAVAMLGGILTVLGGAAYGAVEAVRAVF